MPWCVASSIEIFKIIFSECAGIETNIIQAGFYNFVL